MAVTTYTLTGDLSALSPNGAFDANKVVGWVETNLDSGQAITDTANNKIHVGGWPLTVKAGTLDEDGAFSVLLIASDSDDILPSSGLQYRVRAVYANGSMSDGKSSKGSYNSGWFSLTANADLADKIAEDYIPVTYITQATETLDAYVDTLEAALTALGDGYTTTLTTLHDEMVDLRAGITGDLGTTDSQSATLLNDDTTPSLLRTAADAAFEKKHTRDLSTFASLTAANAALSDGDTLVISEPTTVGATTITKALNVEFRNDGSLNLTDTLTVTLASGGTFRLTNPNITADATMANNRYMIDVTAADRIIWKGGTLADVRRVMRTLDVPIVVVSDIEEVTQFNNPSSTVTGTLFYVRNAWTRVRFTGNNLYMVDTSATVTNAHTGIAIDGGANITIDDNVIEDGYSGIVVRESTTGSTLGDLSENVSITNNTLRRQRATGGPAQGIYVQKSTGAVVISDNRAFDFGGTAFVCAYVNTDNLTYTGNVAVNDGTIAGDWGHYVTATRNASVVGNVATGNIKVPFQVSDSEYVNARGNTARGTHAGPGARGCVLSGLTGGSVDGNDFSSTTGTALRITGAMASTLVGENQLAGVTTFDTAGMTGTILLRDSGSAQPVSSVLVDVGSIRRNTNPSAGGISRWVYTSAGWVFERIPGDVTSVSSTYSVLATDGVVLANGTFTVTLQAPATAGAGKQVTVKNIGSGTITVATSGGGATIDGTSTHVISTQYDSRDFVSNGTNWSVI